MASRLDRLVTLLETGSTQLIRNTAAQQLADVQKAHPEDLFNLLTRIVPYLKSKSWDTRIAAAKAIGGILEHSDKFDPNADDAKVEEVDDSVKQEETDGTVTLPPSDDQLELENLDVTAILTNGKTLLQSAGTEYNYMLASMDPASRLAHQKKTLSSRLGLGGEYIEAELVTEDDIMASAPSTKDTPSLKVNTDQHKNGATSDSGASPNSKGNETPQDGAMSARQLNMLKRKNKAAYKNLANKRQAFDFGDGKRTSIPVQSTPVEKEEPKPEVKEETDGATPDYFSLDRNGKGDDDSKVVSEFKGPVVPEKSELQTAAEERGDEWPFERLCEFLMVDMFDFNWEVRHGATMGLREVLRVHGAGAGREIGKTRAQNNLLNKRWLEDLACRVCCVFMLDRFGDYIADNVVAPIRETAGQLLGALLQYLPPSSVRLVYNVLYRLVMQEDLKLGKRIWEACHGGMIGMRYLVAVRSDVLFQDTELMDGVLQTVMKGLGDFDDDVRAVSAATLVPVAKDFVNMRPSALNGVVTIVWDCLSNLSDDLSASTGSVMDLLAKLCSFPQVLDIMKRNAAEDPSQSFTELVPRLYPFLRHTITGVRSAVLRALLTFLDIGGAETRGWVTGKALRLVYQNLLVERNDGVLKLSLQVWNALLHAICAENSEQLAAEFSSHLPSVMKLTVSPIGVSRNPIPMDATLFIRPSGSSYAPLANGHHSHTKSNDTQASKDDGKKKRRSEKKEKTIDMGSSNHRHNVDGAVMAGDVDLVGADTLLRQRIYASKAMGAAIALWPETSRHDALFSTLLPSLKSTFATTQLFAIMIIEEGATASISMNMPDKPQNTACLEDMRKTFSATLHNITDSERPPAYSDLVNSLKIVRSQTQSLLNTFRDTAHLRQDKLPIIPALVQGEPDAGSFAFSVANAEKIVNTDYPRLKKILTPAQRVGATKALEDARGDVVRAIEEATSAKLVRDVRIRAAAAGAVVALQDVPAKPSTTIKGMMDSIKTEENHELQKRSAIAISRLIQSLSEAGKKTPVSKVTSNLVKFCCMDTSETPMFKPHATLTTGMLSLKKEENVKDDPAWIQEAKAARIMRRGAKEALEQLCHTFGADLFEKVAALRTLIEDPIRATFTDALPPNIRDPEGAAGQEVVDALSTLRALVASFHPDLHIFVLELLPLIAKALQSELAVLRYAAAKCFATICSVITVQGITMLVEQVLPGIKNPVDVACRQGAIECVYHLIHVMEDGILPYVIFLIVPVLGRMSDSDNDVRLIATTSFATLVKLVPLEAGIPDPPGLPQSLLEGREKERTFIAQMLDAKKVEPFVIPVAIKAELRSYQQEGVNWLHFLNKYNLHGILCDDMGLGKTLQTLCIVASDHYNREQEYNKTGAQDMRRLPSLIVCPPTLSGHWQQEIATYAPFLTCTAYVGPPSSRRMLLPGLGTTDIVITSYDVCRNDNDILSGMHWNYCVLDEGHLIKNAKAKTTIAVKNIKSNHRLILSGTPIQNNVLELWSLFDFLMPGFLGSEKVFHDRFAKPIAASRFAKSSSKDQEAGALAIEALHKQVLPFLLRRLKEEVLNDLPPKILQNYYCDVSDLQRKLFEDFSKKEGKALRDKAGQADKESKQHIFQALQYMRKLCNHPSMVVKEGHRQYAEVQEWLGKKKLPSLASATHAPKLTALKDLLVDCGIGKEPTPSGGKDGKDNDALILPSAEDAVSQHRALIFCQMKEMLDLVQNTVLAQLLPGVQYLRLDGSVESSKRQEIVNKFNSDPSYDCLLLTTSVGGLGLNLTGADTVIFVEHDWNPQKDMQAMDRAHRIGQKKVVNVYRLITRGTLEEKILNLQRFKIDVASTVVNQQNAGLQSMQTDQILDLFNLSEGDGAGSLPPPPGDADAAGAGADGREEDLVDATGEVREKGKKGFLDEIGELWDERAYEEEFDLENFLKTMKA